MANILALVLLHMIESLRRDGAFGAFSTGFLTAGVVVLFLYTAWCLFTNLELLDPCVGVELQWLGPFVERMGYNHRKLEWKIFGFLSVCAVLTLPQLIASVGGGLMFRKLGVKVVIERTRAKEAAAATKPAASDVS
jgi:hypothetical protein